MRTIYKTNSFKCNPIRVIVLLMLLYIPNIGCKKNIEVGDPVTSINGGNVYNDDTNAISAVTGIYAGMSNSGFSINLSLFPELSADNLSLYALDNPNYTTYFQNALISDYSTQGTTQFWGTLYGYVYKANAAIDGLNNSKNVSPAIKKRLLGEAYFLRSFCYFYLLNLYGDVPLATSTDYVVNNSLSRTNTSSVYQSVISDLLLAKNLLDNNYVDATLISTTTERVRPNRMAVNALLARVYLYTKNYSAAESIASEVINQTDLYSSTIALDQVFLKNSLETIWALQPVKANFNTDEGNFFIIPSSGPSTVNPVYLSGDLMNAFEQGDKRKEIWVNTTVFESQAYPYIAKYKQVYGSSNISEYPIVLRLAEQYLIRAEARAELNNINGSQSDLNIIRQRAGLGTTVASTTAELLIAILKERRTELFAEWGNRFFDLKRTQTINEVMQSAAEKKGGNWASYKSLFPIPSSEILYNKNLSQNIGYN